MPNHPPAQHRRFEGRVVRATTPQMLVVEVTRAARHPRYHKIFHRHRRFHVHDPRRRFQAGDLVTFVACRPISRTKRWRVVYANPKS